MDYIYFIMTIAITLSSAFHMCITSINIKAVLLKEEMVDVVVAFETLEPEKFHDKQFRFDLMDMKGEWSESFHDDMGSVLEKYSKVVPTIIKKLNKEREDVYDGIQAALARVETDTVWFYLYLKKEMFFKEEKETLEVETMLKEEKKALKGELVSMQAVLEIRPNEWGFSYGYMRFIPSLAKVYEVANHLMNEMNLATKLEILITKCVPLEESRRDRIDKKLKGIKLHWAAEQEGIFYHQYKSWKQDYAKVVKEHMEADVSHVDGHSLFIHEWRDEKELPKEKRSNRKDNIMQLFVYVNKNTRAPCSLPAEEIFQDYQAFWFENDKCKLFYALTSKATLQTYIKISTLRQVFEANKNNKLTIDSIHDHPS